MFLHELQPEDTTEPVWDAVALRGCDFRPHFDGNLYNLFTAVYPLKSKDETETKFIEIAHTITGWILENRSRFSDGDRFQIVVGWPLDVRATGRQCIKTGGTFSDLQQLWDYDKLFTLRDGWHNTIFDAETV